MGERATGRSCCPGHLCLLAVAWLFAAGEARAQSDGTHYQTLIIGDRSMGMGTAFTGVANDGSSVYYNPGGLSFREKAAISGGFWLNAFDRREVKRGLRRDFGDFDLKSRQNLSFPVFAVSSLGLGKKGPDQERRFVVGISSFRVRENNVASHTRMVNPALGQDETFDLATLDRINYFGATLAWRAKRLLGAGVSLFLSRRSYNHSETGVGVSGPEPIDLDRSIGQTSIRQLRILAYHLVMRFGILQTLTPRTTLGLMVQAPGIPLRVRASRRYQLLRYDLTQDPAQGMYSYEEVNDLRATSPIPLEVRVGTAWKFAPRFTWSHDVSLVVPVTRRPVLAGFTSAADAQRLGTFQDPSTRRTPVFNLSTGFQAELGRWFVLEAGAFTDFSSSRRIPDRASVYRSARVHIVGLSSSLAIRGSDRGLALGLTCTMGRGKSLAAVVDDLEGLASYLRTPARSRAIYVSLTGAVEAAEKLVRDAATRVAPQLMGDTPAAP